MFMSYLAEDYKVLEQKSLPMAVTLVAVEYTDLGAQE